MNIPKPTNWLLYIKIKCEWRSKLSTHLFFLALIFSCLNVNAQKENNIWCLGDSAGIDFNQSPPVPITTSLDTRGSCVSIADSTGLLLFYANTRATLPGYTTRVWNSANQLMENGDSIVGRGWYNELIIIPVPGSITKYYLFSAGVTSFYGIYYSIVDMSANNGLGKVIAKNIELNSYKAWDGMAAVKHANGRDWWLITKDDSIGNGNGNNSFHIYFISPDTIIEKIQAIGTTIFGGAGTMGFSKDGEKFLFSTWLGLVEVLQFDRCRGVFSNPIIVSNSGNALLAFGAEFSPNGNIVYVSRTDTISYLFQYDLTAPNISASKDTLCILTHPSNAAGLIRLAPDNKIYWSCAWYNGINFNYPYQDSVYHMENMNLSVINEPDIVGSGCNFSLYSFNLGGKRCYWGLPNNPEYALGPVVGSVCDSLTNNITDIASHLNLLKLYPNPAYNQVEIKFEEDHITEVRIYNSLGKLIIPSKLNLTAEVCTFSVELLSQGVYLVQVKTENGLHTGRLIVQ
jgi:hypothetical protein